MRLRSLLAGIAFIVALVCSTPQLMAQEGGSQSTPRETGYALKKPVFGGACKTCPWGSMADIVKAALQPYGWDVQICYTCAGGAREARIVTGAQVPERRAQNTGEESSLEPPPPDGPVDFGATGLQYLWWAYKGIHDFSKDPEGPRTNIRFVANIQEPSYYLVAVRAESGITDLHQIVEKRMPVQVLGSPRGGTVMTPLVLNYFGLTAEALESFGGGLRRNVGDNGDDLDVFIGWGALNNAPEYRMWAEISQQYNLKFLELPKDLRAKLVREFGLQEGVIPTGLLRGVDQSVPAVVRTGTVVYGRADMPDDFAFTLAKALDEHQDLLQWAGGSMQFSYNPHTVWKAFDIPLHPGAARYYKQVGYMK